MALTIPPHIEKAEVRGVPTAYKLKNTGAYVRENGTLWFDVFKMTCRANLALAAGLMEWVGWRLDGLIHYPKTLQVAESAWAAVVDPLYARRFVPGEEYKPDAPGPIRAPLYDANMFFTYVLDHFCTKGMCQDTVYLIHMALHIMPDKKAFKRWYRATKDRLHKFCFHRGDKRAPGDPVPREAMDPDFDYHPDMATELCRKFLKGLDHTQNPFLHSPEEMKKLGFEGTPYTL